MSKNELNNDALEVQANVDDISEIESAATFAQWNPEENKQIATKLIEKNPERAKEIVRERLSKMTPEQINALRAAKAAKEEATKATSEAAEEEKMAEEVVLEEAVVEPAEDTATVTATDEIPEVEEEVAPVVNEIPEVQEEVVPVVAPVVVAPKKAAKKKAKKSRGISYESRQAFTGFMFVLPWFIGFLLFFAIPCFQSLQFSFSKVAVFDGYACSWIGLENYITLLTSGATYLQALTKTLTDLAVNVPVILIFSLFVAVLLNRKFVGRGLVRSIFFLPVIVTTGVVMTTFQSTGDANEVMQGSVNNGVMFQAGNATEFLLNLGLNETLTEYMSMVADRIFGVVWDSGIQILLFLAALQGISPSLYEASNVEGATAWETFWLITFPNVAPIILVNIVYTIVDTFSDTDNRVLKQIDTLINITFDFGGAAAASWTFFLVVLALIGVVFGVFRLLSGKND